MEARTALRAASLTCHTSKRLPSTPLNLSGRGQATYKRFWAWGRPSKHAEGQTTGRSGRTKKSSSYRERQKQQFFQEGCPGNQLTLHPNQQAQARLSTGAGGLGLPWTEVRQMSASIGWGSYRRL